MANYCWNELEINGDSKILARLVETVAGSNGCLDFNHIVLCKENQENIRDWCINNWGTKWNAIEPNLDYVDGSECAIFSFDTAWSPPVQAVEVLAKAYPELRFKISYEEGGNDFSGYDIYIGGEHFAGHSGDFEAYPVCSEPKSEDMPMPKEEKNDRNKYYI